MQKARVAGTPLATPDSMAVLIEKSLAIGKINTEICARIRAKKEVLKHVYEVKLVQDGERCWTFTVTEDTVKYSSSEITSAYKYAGPALAHISDTFNDGLNVDAIVTFDQMVKQNELLCTACAKYALFGESNATKAIVANFKTNFEHLHEGLGRLEERLVDSQLFSHRHSSRRRRGERRPQADICPL